MIRYRTNPFNEILSNACIFILPLPQRVEWVKYFWYLQSKERPASREPWTPLYILNQIWWWIVLTSVVCSDPVSRASPYSSTSFVGHGRIFPHTFFFHYVEHINLCSKIGTYISPRVSQHGWHNDIRYIWRTKWITSINAYFEGTIDHAHLTIISRVSQSAIVLSHWPLVCAAVIMKL